MSLLDRQLVIVTGKGGVGKTTVAAAIGLAAAWSGRRTLLVELASEAHLARLFGEDGAAGPGREIPLYPGLAGLALEPQRALEEYLTMALRVRALAERLVESRAFGYLAAAAPGLRELVTLGKVWHLAEQRTRDGERRHEVIVVDAPATGHGLGLLRTPRAFLEIARVGRIHEESRAIAELVADPARTGIVLVTRAEEIPVNETLDALEWLRPLGLAAQALVVNAIYPELVVAADRGPLAELAPAGETARAAVRAALSHLARRGEQEAELARLAAATAVPRIGLPFLFRPELDLDGVSELAELLSPSLGELP
ncbi:MAG: ArsA family ATPase [Thermoleophilia bacterium]|nr:ArsA family ATPase [Thermoleophilia bacterium]